MNSQNFSGADLDQLRALSARLKSQSGKMREVANSSTFALMAAEWTGGEIDAIRDQWRRNSLPTITRLADSLEQLGSDLDQHVAEQERVSAGGSGGPLGDLTEWIRRSIDKFILGIVGAVLVGMAPGAKVDGPQAESPSTPPTDQEKSPDIEPKTPEPRRITTVQGSLEDYKVWSQERRWHGPPLNFYADRRGAAVDNCTSWAAYRRDQLGLSVGSPPGHGFEMAGKVGGSPETAPSPGSLVSYKANNQDAYGHVMVVEEVISDNPKKFRVSEMNYQGLGNVRDDVVWTQQPGGHWTATDGRSISRLTISGGE